MWRISPGSLNDAIAADGSEDQLGMAGVIWAYLRYPRLPPAARSRRFCTRTLASLDPQARKLEQLSHEQDFLREWSGHTDMTIMWTVI